MECWGTCTDSFSSPHNSISTTLGGSPSSMKTGILLLQSIASSAFRSGGRTSATYASTRRWSERTSAAFVAAAGVGFVGSVGAVASTSTALCSNSNSNDVNGATAKSPPTTAELRKMATTRKSIDEPDDKPYHNPLLPFPEESLRHDTYDGVTLDLTSLQTTTQTADSFGDDLDKALEIWSEEKRRGIWMKIPTSQSHLIAPATQLHGFDFQHAEPGYCVLTKWLPKETASRLPNGPTHQVGIGALVIHPITGKMLAVQERTGPAAKRKLWKMPTGLTDPGEDIATAAIRELKEETGLDCVFDKIICFRQAHGGLFNRSDMFFVCLCTLAPKYLDKINQGGDIELLPQEEEILMADWIDLEDYATQGVWTESPLYREMNGAMIHAARKGIAYSSESKSDSESHGFVAKNLPVGFRPGHNTIYVSSIKPPSKL